MQNRTLYFGDNLEILRDKIPDESFDLIYLDPPFNSNRSYNVLFKEGLQDSPAQIKAFDDSWHWTEESKKTFDHLVKEISQDISDLMQAFEKILGHNDVLAYLSMMTIRLLELKRVLKYTGSIYLHCDTTVSHYLKIVMDTVFGKRNFLNEITWYYPNKIPDRRKKLFTRSSDRLLFYAKNRGEHKFYIQEEKREHPIKVTKMKKVGGKKIYVRGKNGKVELLLRETRLVDDIWKIPMLMGQAERLGYATQKPEVLLERIINSSTKKGDWVLDPFCGCGTTPAVAEKLGRKWVGIDISTLAINLIKHRLKKEFDIREKSLYIDGLPKDLSGAKMLFQKDPFEFEYWILDLVDAIPAKSKSKGKMRGPDKGIDGVITFYKDKTGDKWIYGKAIVQVKGGTVSRHQIATLRGDVEREGVDAGIFVTMENPSKAMLEEAIEAGNFTTPFTAKAEFPRIQIITVQELLDGKKLKLPTGFIRNYYKEAVPSNKDNRKINQTGLDI